MTDIQLIKLTHALGMDNNCKRQQFSLLYYLIIFNFPILLFLCTFASENKRRNA